MVEAFLLRLSLLDPGEYLFFLGAVFLMLALMLEKRWFASACAFAVGMLWLSFHAPVALYLKSLGTDSFTEANRFDLGEARFWWATMQEEFPPRIPKLKLVVYLIVGASSFLLIRMAWRRVAGWSARTHFAFKLVLGAVMMCSAAYLTTSVAIGAYLSNAQAFESLLRNFDQRPPEMPVAQNKLDVFVYIGESTTVMNMGLYGYVRDTTPRLAELKREDEGFLVFDHVLSTHVHTSQSLLEALSFGVDPRDALLPIGQRKRVALPDVLSAAGVQARLLSNQKQQGAFNQAASILFQRARTTFRYAQERSAEARNLPAPSHWDAEYFASELARDDPIAPGPRVTFLHSYAGHGPYLKNIPPDYRRPVDALLSELPGSQVGSDPLLNVTQWVEPYDSAVRYVDHAIAESIGHVRSRSWPAVLIYFSDHGEAAFKALGHDSARFRHEMARVPFLLYFNEAARREYRPLFERYRARARRGEVATLAQLPSTVADLLDIRPPSPQAAGGLLFTPVVGDRYELPPILVRERPDGISLINLGHAPLPAVAPTGEAITEQVDEDTRLFLGVRSGAIAAQQVCAGSPRSLEELSRRTLLAGCPPDVGRLSVHQAVDRAPAKRRRKPD